jgi:hypothetical protein
MANVKPPSDPHDVIDPLGEQCEIGALDPNCATLRVQDHSYVGH